MNRIENDTRHFLVINTTAYNNDGKYAVQDVEFSGLEPLGFDLDELNTIDLLLVGETTSPDRGLIVIRIA
jgi:hypothetical protein